MRSEARGTKLVRAALFAAFAVLFLVPSAGASFGCGAGLVHCRAEIDNTGRVWFQSHEKLTEDALGDGTLRGGVFQVYRRVGGQTELVSRYPDGRPIAAENNWHTAATLLGVSPDGERVYLQTEASLVPGDVDGGNEGGASDGYVLSGGAYSLFSTGPLDDGGPNPNPFGGTQRVWASDDGAHVFFETARQLVPEDWDGVSDIYERAGGQTRLVTIGPDQVLPSPEFPFPPTPESRLLGVSPDGTTVYFTTAEHLTADDKGKFTSDIFAWRDGVLTRLTRTVSPEEVPGAPWENFDPYSFAAAADGSLYFVASSPQVPEDTDAFSDVYRARPDGTLERVLAVGPAAGNYLRLHAVSRDGSRLFLFTTAQLAPEDRDAEADVYMWSAGTYTLISHDQKLPGGKEAETMLCSISPNGHRAYFQTWSNVTPEDTDKWPDVYEWSEGAVRLVSPAGEGGKESASFCTGISPNGRYVAFTTWEELTPGDTDVEEDIYVVDMGPAASASASVARPQRGKKKRRVRQARLVTAESIAPRMGLPKTGVLAADRARLSLRCPKAERSGPCRGKVTLLKPKSKRVLGQGGFKIPAGRRAAVVVSGPRVPAGSGRFLVRVRAADMLGNRRVTAKPVRFR